MCSPSSLCKRENTIIFSTPTRARITLVCLVVATIGLAIMQYQGHVRATKAVWLSLSGLSALMCIALWFSWPTKVQKKDQRPVNLFPLGKPVVGLSGLTALEVMATSFHPARQFFVKLPPQSNIPMPGILGNTYISVDLTIFTNIQNMYVKDFTGLIADYLGCKQEDFSLVKSGEPLTPNRWMGEFVKRTELTTIFLSFRQSTSAADYAGGEE